LSSIQLAACGCTTNRFYTTSEYFHFTQWNSCAPTASDKVCTMGCACNRAEFYCSDFCSSTPLKFKAGLNLGPRAWFPSARTIYSPNTPSVTLSVRAYYAELDWDLDSFKKTDLSSRTKFVFDWVEDTTMKAACMSGMTCVCVCCQLCIQSITCLFLFRHHRM
jgi:hypothetical protein